MRKSSILVGVYLLFFSAFFSVPISAVELVADGVPLADIIIQSDADKVTLFAAKELQKYIEKISGAKLPIKRYTENQTTPTIYIGNVCSNISFDLPPKPRYEEDDNFVLKTKDNSVCISGCSPRATLFGVYAFLEQLGCRWPLPGEDFEVIPKLKNISWSVSEIESEPAIPHRGITFSISRHPHSGLDETLVLVDWLAKNRFNFIFLCGPKLPSEIMSRIKDALAVREMGLEWGLHWLPKYLPRKLFKEHPEYFRMEKGERTEKLNMCPSNSEAADIIARNSLNDWGELQDFPLFETLHIWPDDLYASGWCSCEKCKGLTDSDLSLKIINEVARRLPLHNTAVAHLSYHTTIYPPKNIKPEKNVRLFWAPRERCYKHAMGECQLNRQYLKCLKGQIQMFSNEPEVFEYYHDMVLFRALPMPLHPVIGKDAKIYCEAGVARISSLSFGEFSKWAYGPNYYVMGKSLWRGEGDSRDTKEYCEAMYGPYAEKMKKYFDLLFELCGTVTQRCGYELNDRDMRCPPYNSSCTKIHLDLLAPMVTPEYFDKIEGVLKNAIIDAVEPYRTRIKNQLLLWKFARLDISAVYRTMLARYLKNSLGPDATDTNRLSVIAIIKEALQEIDEANKILLASPKELSGPLPQDKGIMKSRLNWFGNYLSHWIKEIEKQQ